MTVATTLDAFALTRSAWQPGGAWRQRLPGLLVAAVLAFVADGLAAGLGDPWSRNPVLVAMLLGLGVGMVFGCPELLIPGLQFTTRFLLRLAIAMVGLRITWRLVLDVGAIPIGIAAIELALMFAFTWFVARRIFTLDRGFAVLLAAGSSICGAAAILAVATVIKAPQRDASIAVTAITLFGTIALFVYPYAFLEGYLPGLDDEWYGVFVGASVYELAQVYGAAASVSELALGTATLIKLIKVLMLIPLLIVIRAVWRRVGDKDASGTIPFPWYILGFVGFAVFNSLVSLPGPLRAGILRVDVFLFTMVMVALGLNTRAERLRENMPALRIVGASTLALGFAIALTYGLVQTGMALNDGRGFGAQASAAGDSGQGFPTGEGARLFRAIGCTKCHVPALRAGDFEVTLYSDLLLHDMGPALDDKITQGDAEGRDWRTAPLIGLALRQRYLHDGRATTLRDAIVAHGGSAETVRDRFLRLDEFERDALLRFLDGL